MASAFQFLGRFRGALVRIGVLTDGQVLIGDTGAVPKAKAISGDATLAKTGALTIAAGALAASAGGRAKMADGFFTEAAATAKFVAGAITGALLKAGTVTAAKAAVFVSAEQTATGAAQDVAHGLGAVPSKVLIVPTETTDAGIIAGGYDVAEGAHDGTNVKVTATANLKFKVFAWA